MLNAVKCLSGEEVSWVAKALYGIHTQVKNCQTVPILSKRQTSQLNFRTQFEHQCSFNFYIP